MNFKAKWIIAGNTDVHTAPLFRKKFNITKPVKKAELFITALGVYEARLNRQRVGDFIMAPGYTAYRKRIQYQCYDITSMLWPENTLEVTVGRGWFASRLTWLNTEDKTYLNRVRGLLAELHILYEDGTEEIIVTDTDWKTAESPVRFSEIYDGEHYDATFVPEKFAPALIYDHPYDVLIPQEGEICREVRRVMARRVFTTPKGEIMVDFGQEVTGYVEFTVSAPNTGDEIHILHSEVMDKEGNFYNENYRSARAEICYTCKAGYQTYHPLLTFFGFRYIKLDKWPVMDAEKIRPEQFTAVFVSSDLRQTGYVNSSSPLLNQLFSNVIFSQMGNFLDVPTDCPQRDERLGWTGDAQVFCKAASYNFDTLKFYRKWLHDMEAEQFPIGGIPWTVPDPLFQRDETTTSDDLSMVSSAWGDACCIIPWQLYETYRDISVLEETFPMMEKWIGYIQSTTTTPDLWTGGKHYGDWLGLDAPSGSYKGSTPDDFISSAFYYNSLGIVLEAGNVLGKDVERYREQYLRTRKAFMKTFPVYTTQTEHVLALHFGLCKDPDKTAKSLARLIKRDGFMKTGFLGTPYILHVLTDYGYTELAYSLLLREKYPSWLFSVKQGATTIWEHWDGIMEDGSFWSSDMNSYNHYSYGAVIDWVYEKALGMRPAKEEEDTAEVVVAPHPSKKLAFLEGWIDTVKGRIASKWVSTKEGTRYDIILPAEGYVVIDGVTRHLPAGSYTFFGK